MSLDTRNKLLLGSGDWDWLNWTSIDGNPTAPSTYHAIIPPLPPEVKHQQWDVIMAIHFIEHIPPWMARILLLECNNILVEGGELILEQPNIHQCARYLLGIDETPEGLEPGQYDMWGFYGNPGPHDELMLHRWGYHPESMRALLLSCGFENSHIHLRPAEFHHPVRDFRMVAVKT